MPEIHGNTEGIRKTVLDELTTLYDVQLEPGQFMPQDLLQSLCGYSASMNREIAVYITRFGEVADVLIGRADSIDLPDLRLRRGEPRAYAPPRHGRVERRGRKRAFEHAL